VVIYSNSSARKINKLFSKRFSLFMEFMKEKREARKKENVFFFLPF
jgi:hypothetical protein